jgi:hypothetical protein
VADLDSALASLDDPDGDAANLYPYLPGSGPTRRFVVLTTAVYLLFLGVVAASAPGAQPLAIAGYGLGTLTGVGLLLLVARGPLARRFLRQHGATRGEAPKLASGLAASGVRELILCVDRGRRFRNRAFRRGGTAIVSLHVGLLAWRDDATRFVIAHELAHAARDDTARSLMYVAYAASACVAVLIWWPDLGPLTLLVLLAYLAILMGCTWSRELDCDRIAVACVSSDGALLFFSRLLVAQRRTIELQASRRARVRLRLRRLRAPLTHPPVRLRRSLSSRWRRPER